MKRPSKLPAIVTIIACSTFAQAQSLPEDMANIINNEELIAAQACIAIQQDNNWQEILNKLHSLADTHGRAPYPSEVSDIGMALRDINEESWEFFNKNERDIKRDGIYTTNGGSFWGLLLGQRISRTLRKCGEDLIKKGYFIPYLTSTAIIENTEAYALDYKTKTAPMLLCLNDSDKSLLDAYSKIKSTTKKQKEDRVSLSEAWESLSEPLYKCIGESNFSLFPYHHLTHKWREFYSDEKTNKTIDEVINKAFESTRKYKAWFEKEALERQKQSAQNEEFKARINKIKAGNMKAAQSCGEISSALIPELKSGATVSRYLLSKDTQNVYARPTNQFYSTVGTIISLSDGAIITADTNSFTGHNFAYILKTNRKTVYFRNAAVGRKVYFVGKYTGNGSVTYGQNKQNIPARITNVLCIDGL